MLKEKVCLEAGCDFKSSNASVFDHEKDCDFRSVRCPILDCYSVVVFNGLERHMEEKHANMADGKWHIFEVRDNGQGWRIGTTCIDFSVVIQLILAFVGL